MKCLILGGRGFLGSHLSEALVSEGHEVRIFDRPKLPDDELRINAGVERYEGDFLNRNDVLEAIAGCDIIFHLISATLPRSSNENPIYDVEANVVSTLHLLESACRQGVRKIIFVSSGGTVYGVPQQIPIKESHPTEPTCSYGIVKLTIEKYLHLFHVLHGLEYCILRLANPFGPYQRITSAQGAVTVFLSKAMRDEPIEIWGDGSVVRDYFYVSDAISALVRAASYQGDVRIFNIGSGAGKSLNEILDAIDQLLDIKATRQYKAARTFDVPVNILDHSMALRHLKWKPAISFDEGLEKTAQWLQTTL